MRMRMRIGAIVLGGLMLTVASHAGEIETWNFELSTEGEDVFWTSPTSVRTNAPQYDGTITITEVLVWGLADIGFGDPLPVGPIDVTDDVPPDQLTQSGSIAGPPPVLLLNQTLVYPEPPKDPTIAADVVVELDAKGFVQVSATNITLGTTVVNISPFGDVEVQLTQVAASGQVEVVPVGVIGDLNGDEIVGVADLLQVLGAWGPCENPKSCPEDFDNDGAVGVSDLLTLLGAWG